MFRGVVRGPLLIAVEGLYAAGKTTQIAQLSEHLRSAGAEVTVSSWNSSPSLAEHVLGLRRQGRLSPRLLFLLELADFTDRLERVIEPALNSGGIVITDRYVTTGLARAVVRGVDRGYCVDAYRFAPRPDLTILLAVEPAVTVSRRRGTGRGMDGYVSGADFLDGPADVEERFVVYQRLVDNVYRRELAGRAVLVDGAGDVEAVARRLWKAVAAQIRGGP